MRALSLWQNQRARWLLQISAILLIVLTLAYALYRSRNEFQQTYVSLDYGMVSLAVVLWLASYILFALGWNLVLKGLGSPIGWWPASRVFFLSQGLKYIPGSVVYVFGRVHLAQEAGVRAVPAAVGLGLESLLATSTALLVFLAALPLGILQEPLGPVVISAMVGVFASVLVLPLLLKRLSSLWSDKFAVTLEYRTLALLSGFYFLIWLVVGLACYVSLKSLGDGLPLGLFQVLGLYSVSWAVGMMAVFAPGGVGVRDGILILLLSGFVPLPLAALGAALIRILTLFVEGVLAAIAMKLKPPVIR